VREIEIIAFVRNHNLPKALYERGKLVVALDQAVLDDFQPHFYCQPKWQEMAVFWSNQSAGQNLISILLLDTCRDYSGSGFGLGLPFCAIVLGVRAGPGSTAGTRQTRHHQ